MCEGVTLLSEGEPHSICSSAFLPLGVSWFSAHCYAVDYEGFAFKVEKYIATENITGRQLCCTT